eukprot:CAMPEP_0116121494 /NCGR_PEP_ID=MMETSP0329-20121206/3727_1 /TAXON_ID=697910 /ORGANISM="Pseudo-nitzschia arenysensis, Strain B593" /LENGTH=531 /DNA_ID=CAMNT_0003615311 /DNA_START=273 /DNA_END=1868 /DNA_ORIENTATION=-
MNSDSASSMDVSGGGSSSSVDMTVEDEIDEEMIEKLWAKERYEMEVGDREATDYELHGVESRYDTSKLENPENHYEALILFDNELNNPDSGLSEKKKRGYLRALRLKSSYISSSDFRLRFLRAEFFDIPKAVARFCNCLNFMLDLYGEDSLLRQLFITDLTKRERKLLKEGSMQLSPTRDSLGRRTMFLLGNVGENYSTRERDRTGFYFIYQVLAEDETTQRNGLVTVHLMSEGVQKSMGGENMGEASKTFVSFFESCPLRFSAIHMCFPNELLYRLLKPIMLWVVGNTGRKCLRIHSGTRMECDYSLNTFGVRPDDVPTTYSGTIKTRQHARWLKVRGAMDDFIKQQCRDCVDGDYRDFYASDKHTIKPFPYIQCPEINCVLFHKNGVAWEFPGNVAFRAFLDEQLPFNHQLNIRSPGTTQSNGSDGPIKEGFVNRIARLSLERNFRFLLHDETKHLYNELKNPAILRRYIGFAIRGRQRRVGAKRQRQGWENSDIGDTRNNRNQGTESAVFTNMDGRDFSANICHRQKR